MLSLKLRQHVLRRDRFRCCQCGRTARDGVSLEVDHKKPAAQGGKDSEENLWTLCDACNRGKSDAWDDTTLLGFIVAGRTWEFETPIYIAICNIEQWHLEKPGIFGWTYVPNPWLFETREEADAVARNCGQPYLIIPVHAHGDIPGHVQ